MKDADIRELFERRPAKRPRALQQGRKWTARKKRRLGSRVARFVADRLREERKTS